MNTVIQGSLGKVPDLDVSVQAAAVLLSLAMRDTENPVSDLGQALSRMVSTVTALRTPACGSQVNGPAPAPSAGKSYCACCVNG